MAEVALRLGLEVGHDAGQLRFGMDGVDFDVVGEFIDEQDEANVTSSTVNRERSDEVEMHTLEWPGGRPGGRLAREFLTHLGFGAGIAAGRTHARAQVFLAELRAEAASEVGVAPAVMAEAAVEELT